MTLAHSHDLVLLRHLLDMVRLEVEQKVAPPGRVIRRLKRAKPERGECGVVRFHARKVGEAPSERLWRLRHNTARAGRSRCGSAGASRCGARRSAAGRRARSS